MQKCPALVCPDQVDDTRASVHRYRPTPGPLLVASDPEVGQQTPLSWADLGEGLN